MFRAAIPFLLAALIGCSIKPDDAPEAPKPGAAERAKPTREGSDWPQLLGPNRDGVCTETGILKTWPKEGLKKLWDCKLGVGYAPPAVVKGKLYHFDRVDDVARA